jgi:hypothetical protein
MTDLLPETLNSNYYFKGGTMEEAYDLIRHTIITNLWKCYGLAVRPLEPTSRFAINVKVKVTLPSA